MIRVESGHDLKAVRLDPMQVNNRGDWPDNDDYKSQIGLSKGVPPGPELGVKAGIDWLESKAYHYDAKGRSGKGAGAIGGMGEARSNTGWRWIARRAGAAAGVVLVLAPTLASAADCFGGLRGALERDGYTGNMDCSLVHQTVEYVGRTKSHHGPAYLVYHLSYRTKTHGWGVAHGGAAILIFDRRLHYLGSYRIMAGYRLRIDGSDVVVNLPAADGNRVHLEGHAPPPTEHLDGGYVSFDK